jgi:hypothetical protein
LAAAHDEWSRQVEMVETLDSSTSTDLLPGDKGIDCEVLSGTSKLINASSIIVVHRSHKAVNPFVCADVEQFEQRTTIVEITYEFDGKSKKLPTLGNVIRIFSRKYGVQFLYLAKPVLIQETGSPSRTGWDAYVQALETAEGGRDIWLNNNGLDG